MARVLSVLAGVLALFILLNVAKGFYSEWFWYSNLGYAGVYTTILRTRVIIFFLAAIIFAILMLGNLVLATRLVSRGGAHFWPWALIPQLRTLAKLNVILGTAVLSLIFGLVAQGNWELVLRFFNAQPFWVSPTPFLTGRLASTSSRCPFCSWCEAGYWGRW